LTDLYHDSSSGDERAKNPKESKKGKGLRSQITELKHIVEDQKIQLEQVSSENVSYRSKIEELMEII